MNPNKPVALIQFVANISVPRVPFAVQARFPTEASTHPYGHRSLRIEPLAEVADRLVAQVELLSGPQLVPGMRIELFRGRQLLGTALVQRVFSQQPVDVDILPDPHAPMRTDKAA